MAAVCLLARPEPERRRGRARGRATAQRVADLIEAGGHDVIDISGAAAADRRRLVEGAERLVAAGGDGTVHLALQAVAGTSTVLGIVPAGTGNDFARAFGLKPGADLEAAVARALGPYRATDAISTPRGWVATSVTGGFSADVNRRASDLKFPAGSSRYTAATLAMLPRLKTRPVTVVADGETRRFDATMVVAANTAFFGAGMAICPEADPGDGLLDVLVVGSVGRVELLRLFPRVFKGTHVTHPAVSQFRGRVVEIDGDGIELWGDGEPLGPSPLRLEAGPGVLRLAF